MEAPICAWPAGCDRPARKVDHKQRKFCERHGASYCHGTEWVALPGEYLPVKPLLDIIEGRGGTATLWAPLGLEKGHPERVRLDKNIHRARERGLMRYDIIDELCCRYLRKHPAEIYGDDWWLEDEAEEVAA